MRKVVLVIAAAAALCACQPRLVILHTNDTHSQFEPQKGGKYDGRGGVIERAAYVDSVRAAVGENKVLLLHAGDFNQGSSYYSVFGGALEVETVNAFRYDCIALGNHEFDNGIEDLAERVKNISCPVVCANLDLRPFELGEYVKPYAILERGGMKIGIIGLDADLSTCVAKPVSSRIQQLDNVEVTNKWSDVLKNEEKCDLVILLSHLGYDEDQKLVPLVRNIDIVVGGHSHSFVDGFVYVSDADGKKVPVITDGCWGEQMGEIKVYR